jgi:hypothetical protein
MGEMHDRLKGREGKGNGKRRKKTRKKEVKG